MHEQSNLLDNSVVLDSFVALEGLDGAGTTTQLRLIGERLQAKKIPHFCTGEPTSGPVGRQIRSILKREIQVDPCSVALLFAADRNEHLYEPERGILACLRRGELVISDRYLFSSLAYQSLGCPFEYVRELNRPFPLPRLVFFIDTPVKLSQERLSRRESAAGISGTFAGPGELFDGLDIQQQVIAAYERSFALFAGTRMELVRIDGKLSAPEVFENLWKNLLRLPILGA